MITCSLSQVAGSRRHEDRKRASEFITSDTERKHYELRKYQAEEASSHCPKPTGHCWQVTRE